MKEIFKCQYLNNKLFSNLTFMRLYKNRKQLSADNWNNNTKLKCTSLTNKMTKQTCNKVLFANKKAKQVCNAFLSVNKRPKQICNELLFANKDSNQLCIANCSRTERQIDFLM